MEEKILQPRRKRLLINLKFQALFALYAVVTTLIMVPFFVVANYYFFNRFDEKASAIGLPPSHEIVQFVKRQQTLMVVVFIFATVFVILVNMIVSYIVSNRIAGSMYRLTTAMNQANDIASAEKIHPRRHDFFTEVLEAYNQLLDRSRV
jgi:hypothetical protein